LSEKENKQFFFTN